MKTSDYPSILIIGSGFNLVAGGGITLTNLFKGWPKDQLAVATGAIECINLDVCENYYRLGSLEDYWVWPFSYVKRTGKLSGPVTTRSLKDGYFSENKNPEPTMSRNLFYTIINIMGTQDLMRRLRVSHQFLEWVKAFSPDLIYSQLETLNLIRFVDELSRTMQLPSVIHIMDDWPSTIYRQGLFSPYMRWRADAEFRNLIKRSTALGISQAMCDEYKERYRKEFTPFHNPVDLNLWIKNSKKTWEAGSPFRVRYGGRVGIAIQQSLIDIADAIEEINNSGVPIVFDLYIDKTEDEFIKHISEYRTANVFNKLPYNQVPISLAEADLLVIPYDFDEKSKKFARLSMPTKVVEDMASGTPILIYASEDYAVTKYAQKEGWGFVVSERDRYLLKKGIQTLIENSYLRENLGRKAIERVLCKHDADIIRKEFRKKFVEAITKE